jgi:hypothetical protein
MRKRLLPSIMNYAGQITALWGKKLIVTSAAESAGNYCTEMNVTSHWDALRAGRLDRPGRR